MKPVTKGLIKGALQVFELFQGILTGFFVQKMYNLIDTEQTHETEEPTRIKRVLDIAIYVFILISITFIIRESNITFSTNFIIKNMGYDKFDWPPPVMLGFGLLFFQDSFKEKIKTELNLNEMDIQ